MNKMIRSLMCVLMALPAVAQAQDYSQSTSSYANNLGLRQERRVGVGLQAGGLTGLIGMILELNIEDQDGTLVTAGLGNEFSTFALAWKHNFEGRYFTPYTTLGWSRWYNSTTHRVSGSHVLSEILSEDEKATGRFGVDFLAGALGMQYQELEGEFAGASFFGEINLLYSPDHGRLIPTVGLGSTYFF